MSKTFDSDPCYGLALLKTAFEISQQPHKLDSFEETFPDIAEAYMDNFDISPLDFKDYLKQYRNDLRHQCKKKGLA